MKKDLNKRKILLKNIILFGVIAILLAGQVLALGFNNNSEPEPNTETSHDQHAMPEKFKAGDMIVEHIIDNHEWHILSYKDFHLSLPLPVILVHEGKLHTFLSSRFNHQHSPYQGFGISHEGEYKGKIVRVDQAKFSQEGVITQDPEQKLPLDFSITKTVLAIFISLIIMTWLFLHVAGRYRKNAGEAPSGIQSMLEPLILFIRDDIAKPSIGEKKYQRYMPFLLTLFFFIFLNNLLGLVPIFPGGANVTGNIAVTMVLAVFTFLITSFSANKNYWVHIVNTPGVPWWLKFPVPLMPVVELIGVFTKPFVLMVRLFANITAGHIIVLGFISLIFIFGQMNPGFGYGISIISIAFSIFMNLLELLVAFIQAYVFTLLSALYFGMAIEEHH